MGSLPSREMGAPEMKLLIFPNLSNYNTTDKET
jgi:hypothetical protein